jgi:hypothetical protein
MQTPPPLPIIYPLPPTLQVLGHWNLCANLGWAQKKTLTLKAKHKTKGLGIVTLIFIKATTFAHIEGVNLVGPTQHSYVLFPVPIMNLFGPPLTP